MTKRAKPKMAQSDTSAHQAFDVEVPRCGEATTIEINQKIARARRALALAAIRIVEQQVNQQLDS